MATKNMRLTDLPLSKLKIPEGIIIAAVHRGEEAIIPNGDTIIEEGDKVIVFFLLSQLQNLEKFFQTRKWSI
jgi:trk system potassium uptake protein TrkA